ncbi:MAG: hypothetical protein HY270_02875 [Deltaproteobacteria bacterium]|nr:hypothetical protein [Deltaproteobacteria bacterium]
MRPKDSNSDKRSGGQANEGQKTKKPYQRPQLQKHEQLRRIGLGYL